MEEKKLTDEEIAKAILQSIEYSKTITYFDEWGNCKAIRITDILDLIHRLQSEKKELRESADLFSHFNEKLNGIITEQKAEIERLTEENGYLKQCADNFLADYQKAQKQVDELMRDKGFLIAERIYIKEQAGKDTAKEILQYVGDLYDDGDQRFQLKDYQWHKNLCKKYGVEVE